MGTMARLMPGHDPHWKDKLDRAKARQAALLCREGLLTAAEQEELARLRLAIDRAFNSSFRTTAEYRDFHLARARELMDAEGLGLALPDIADDATPEEIDRALDEVLQAVRASAR